jgi:hypothetical protein
MSNDQRVSIDLSPAQPRDTKPERPTEVDFAELRVVELEERIAPLSCTNGTHIPEVKL